MPRAAGAPEPLDVRQLAPSIGAEIHGVDLSQPQSPEPHDRNNRGRENNWHSDVTWRREPSLGSILRAVVIPEIGGDTLFANMELAYDDLEDELKAKLDGVMAIHDAPGYKMLMRHRGASDEEMREIEEKYPPWSTPSSGRIPIRIERASM